MTPERDQELRRLLAVLYRQARSIVQISSNQEDDHWPVHPTSTAATEEGISTRLWSYIAAEFDWEKGLNLPLTQARALLNEAAACFDVLAAITMMPSDASRLAGISPVARSAAEKAATVHWILAGDDPRPNATDRLGRLARSLLVEISGIERLLEFHPKIGSPDTSRRLSTSRDRFIEIAETECGPVTYTKTSGRLQSIAGVTLPNLTARVTVPTTNVAYAEQSAGTHPTGHSATMASRRSSARYGIVASDAHSTVHGEGRLIEPAVMALGLAVTDVGSLIGPTDEWPLPDWASSIVETWGTWCSQNGCA